MTAQRKPVVDFAEEPSAFASFSAMEQGVPSASVRALEAQGLTRADIRQIIPDRTLDRRIAKGEPLKIEEADGLARLLRLGHALVAVVLAAGASVVVVVVVAAAHTVLAASVRFRALFLFFLLLLKSKEKLKGLKGKKK